MDNIQNFYYTLILSIIIQIITAVVVIISIFKVSTEYFILKQLLIVELLVQFIEGIFYFWLIFNFKHFTDITYTRYIDWSISTPIMLITLILYLIYSYYRKTNDTAKLEFVDLIKKNSKNIIIILILNWLMLIFGYLGEKNIINKYIGITLGFIPFILYYILIYINYVKTKEGRNLFVYFFIFWSLYGIAALLPYYLKNSSYNILDLFSKNFFGVFLSYIILTGNY
jgi:hypothetical protein